MLTKQQVLNHVKGYFKDCIDYNGGITGSGWANCALGSLVIDRVSDICFVQAEVVRVLGTQPYDYWDETHMYKKITRFNDKHCGGNYPLTVELVNKFLFGLAYENDLVYDIIVETELNAIKANHNVLKETDRETS